LNRLLTGLIIATTIYLVFIVILVTTHPRNEPSVYIDDVSILADGVTIHALNFDTNNTKPGEYVGDISTVKYSVEEYVSPPRSLVIPKNSSRGTVLLIQDDPFVGWDELRISFMTKIRGTSPPHMMWFMWIDDGYLGSTASVQLGEKDLLSGASNWEAYAAWDSPSTHTNWDDSGKVGWDWSTWHKVDLIFSRSTSKFTCMVDSNTLFSTGFGCFYGSNLKVWWES
jgi:hypothetical protein